MTFHQRAARVLLIVVGLAMMAGAARAQSITVGPARPGGNPSSLTNTSFPGAVTITVASFTATPSGGASGGAVSLAWTGIVNGTTCSIDNGVGAVTCANSSTGVAPTVTTTYTMTVSNSAGSTTRTATVFIIPSLFVDSIQRGVLTIAVGTVSTTSASLTVTNSALAFMVSGGFAFAGGAAPADSGHTYCRVILNVVDATHVTVTAHRALTGGGTYTASCAYEVTTLSASMVQSVQYIATTPTTAGINVLIGSVNVNKSIVLPLFTENNGISAVPETVNAYCRLADATHVNCLNGDGVNQSTTNAVVLELK